MDEKIKVRAIEEAKNIVDLASRVRDEIKDNRNGSACCYLDLLEDKVRDIKYMIHNIIRKGE